MSKNPHISWLKDIRKKDISSVGGKAANLGELYSKFPIPDGFCINVRAFETFLEEVSIYGKISALLKKIDVNKSGKIQSISKNISKLITKSKIPKEIEAEIVKNYEKVKGFVAVRS
ncbi:MAG: PEP/pyruvate-binding domain-containing protein, partial [Candidatus Woesearchaeota archaeon]|nr:PEP/pyruvate-binding domain-containing protein [Candidatus Woesearchaeota archaeon]